MQKLWKKLAVAVATVCLATGGMFCLIGCGDNTKSGTVYQYKSTSYSYTDTYNLYDDGSYERIYEGPDFSRTTTIETGTYKKNGSTVTFTAETAIEEQWPSGPYKHWYLINPYSGYLDTNLSINATTYTKHGSITKTSN
ncbi:MAG: hypothetical protein K2M90_08020 [Treponemataceae bacterium]|nr:hypothetical protein [Treponemataceae bacterium]MDE7392385.1 hypothetical protein [Treponemataceae bacterium]